MNTNSFFNLFLMYLVHRNPECPHILYNEDIEAACCQKEIVDLHMGQRTTVAQWLSTNENVMKWDKELSEMAQNITRKCKFKNEQVEVEDRRFKVGQNTYLKCSVSDDIIPNWKEPIQYWFSKDKVRPNYARSLDTGKLTWKKLHSESVGCGYANYKINETNFFFGSGVGVNISGGRKNFCQMYVCLYGLQ